MYAETTTTKNNQVAVNIMDLSNFDFKVIQIALKNYSHQLKQLQTENPDVIVTADFTQQSQVCETLCTKLKL